MPTSLTTVTLVQQQLGITGGDALLTNIVAGVNAGLETMLNISFGNITYTNEEYDMNKDNRVLVLRHTPIITFTNIQFKNSPLDYSDTSWTSFQPSEYVVDLDSGLVTKNTVFWAGKRLYRATYSAGINSVPADVQMAATALAAAIYQQRGRPGVTQETLGQYSRTFSNDPLNWKALGIDWILQSYLDKNKTWFGDAYRPPNTNFNIRL